MNQDLSTTQRADLARWEQSVKLNTAAADRYASATRQWIADLLQIYESNFWTASHSSFQDYCSDTFGWNENQLKGRLKRCRKLHNALLIRDTTGESLGAVNQSHQKNNRVSPTPGNTYCEKNKESSSTPVTSSVEAVSEERVVDETGLPIPRDLLQTWAIREKAKRAMELLTELEAFFEEVHRAADRPMGITFDSQGKASLASRLRSEIKNYMPHCVCFVCQGHGRKTGQCAQCHGVGLIGMAQLWTVPLEDREMRKRSLQARQL